MTRSTSQNSDENQAHWRQSAAEFLDPPETAEDLRDRVFTIALGNVEFYDEGLSRLEGGDHPLPWAHLSQPFTSPIALLGKNVPADVRGACWSFIFGEG